MKTLEMGANDWIEIASATATTAVAVAVFIASRSQARISNAISVRAAAVEDQKFRLALLDRRQGAIESVRRAREHFWLKGATSGEALRELRVALEQANLVFERVERTAMDHVLKHLLDLSMLAANIAAIPHLDLPDDQAEIELQRLNDRYYEAYVAAVNSMGPLVETLEKASWVAQLPPLVLKPPKRERA